MHRILQGISFAAAALLLIPSLTLAATLTQHLQYGSSGSQVTLLQQLLVGQGFLGGSPTGYYGSITRQAVMNFQKDKGFEQTGEVGPQTRAALNSVNPNQALIDALIAQVKVLQAKIAALLAGRAATTSTGTGTVSPTPTPTPASQPTSAPMPTPTPTPTPSPTPTPTPTPSPTPTPTPPASDTTAPSITVTAPSGALAAGTTQTALSVTTNEAATCAYSSAAGAAFASMTAFGTTGGSSHSSMLTGLTNGTSYTRYVKCKDVSGNISADSTASFSVAATVSPTPPPPTPPPSPTPTPPASPPPPPTTSVVNIKTDFGATCNGTGDDSAAFRAFNAWALQWQQTNTGLIELDIPSGSVCEFMQNGGGIWLAMGIKKLKVVGYGATITDNNGAGGGFFLGGRGVIQDKYHSARVATVGAGATSVTLLNPSDASKFTVGKWALMSGLDLMGYGYPPNPEFFDYVQITGINGSTITFSQPLRYVYKSTWPLYWGGSDFEADQGGPATLYALDPSWDTEVEYKGLNISGAYQVYAGGRSITYTDVTLSNACGIPSQNLVWTMTNSTCNGNIEVDKLVGTMNINNSTIGSMDFQSSSIDTLQGSGLTITRHMNGTPKVTNISNANFASLGVGTYAYGASNSFACSNCVMSSVFPMGISANVGPVNASGVITYPNSDGPQTWAVPGVFAAFQAWLPNVGIFKVLDVTQDSNNTYVQTTMNGGLPAYNINGSAVTKFTTHSMPSFTCSNCSGSTEAVDLSGAPAGASLWSYSRRTFSGNIGTHQAVVPVWGKFVSVKINVTKPYTGSKQNVKFSIDGPFIVTPSGTLSSWDPQVNLAVAGERTITVSSVTGLQSGDTITAPGAIWLVNNQITPKVTTDLSTDDPSTLPTVTIEFITDQGVGNIPASQLP